MLRVRNHAAEYAALKARAQAAGLSTRSFRRARKAEPERYYAPRALAAKHNRERIVSAIVGANEARGAKASFETLAGAAIKHSQQAPDKVVRDFVALWESSGGEDFWDQWDNYEYEDYDVDSLAYYHE